MKTLSKTRLILAVAATAGIVAATLSGPVAVAQVTQDCFFLQDSGVMCDTECTGSLGCFDQSSGTCCWDSMNACGMHEGCEACEGTEGCHLGDF